MQHPEIERDCLIDRYVRNTLPVAERQAFEEHFLDCPLCLEQLEIASSLRQAIRESAVEPVTVAQPRRWFVWNWVQAAAAVCLIVSVATSIVFYQQMQHARNELASAKSTFERGLATAPEVYVLAQSRGSSESKEIVLPREPRWMVFSVEMDTTQFPNYRAILSDSSGKTIWQQEAIRPTSPDAIAVSVPSTLLTPGAYTLTIGAVRFPLQFK